MHRTPDDWAKMKPSAVLGGSAAQAANVLGMARDDFVSLNSALSAIMEAAELGDIDACHELARVALTRADPMQPISAASKF